MEKYLYLILFFSFVFSASYSQCPTVEAIMVNACGSEGPDEFILVHSGSVGFNTSDLQFDFDHNNNNFGQQNNDIHIDNGNNPSDPTPCSFVPGDASIISGCSNVISVGLNTFIPPNSILIVQTGNSASYVYDYSSLCGSNECVYVIKNSCDRTSGAFTNGGSGTRTTIMSLSDGSGCSE
ncbi:MAG TPA: hypothetical protein ENK85_09675, partial [Saprospiraceae bacterium]|nr:hypothetical protein [Saprospiraceae bacterium]